MRKGLSFRFVVMPALAAALIASACGGNGDAGADQRAAGGGTGNGEELSGKIFVSGSSTVEPITALAGELFAEQYPNVSVAVEGPGTGDGFELFCNGETDISDASRPIEEEEVAACKEKGIEYTELEVAFDGISVLTSLENDEVTCLANTDLYALLGPESQGFDGWSDANQLGKELGAPGVPYPNAPLDVTAPGEESGTYDAFIELALGDIIEEREQEEVTRPDYTSSPNDNVIIEGIAGSPTSLGWVGYSFYEQNQDVVKAIEIDGGEGCVAPSPETIADGSYPLSRSLYIYVNKEKAQNNPALRAFVDYYMTDEVLQAAVQEVGYVTLPPDRIEKSRSEWDGAPS